MLAKLFSVPSTIIVALVLVFSVYGYHDPTKDNDSDENDQINQALLLVNLLRAEYMKVLQDQKMRREALAVSTPNAAATRTVANNTAAPSTSSTTSPLPPVIPDFFKANLSSQAVALVSSDQPITLSATLSPSTYKNLEGIQFIPNLDGFNYRRRMPDLKPAEKASQVMPTIHQIYLPNQNNVIKTAQKLNKAEEKGHTVLKTTFDDKIFRKEKDRTDSGLTSQSKVLDTDEVFRDQVASELISEFKGRFSRKGKNKGTINNNDAKLSNRQETKDDDLFMTYKTTLRIHLGRSTRPLLPLSENNAFCFFHPRSRLCSLLI